MDGSEFINATGPVFAEVVLRPANKMVGQVAAWLCGALEKQPADFPSSTLTIEFLPPRGIVARLCSGASTISRVFTMEQLRQPYSGLPELLTMPRDFYEATKSGEPADQRRI